MNFQKLIISTTFALLFSVKIITAFPALPEDNTTQKTKVEIESKGKDKMTTLIPDILQKVETTENPNALIASNKEEILSHQIKTETSTEKSAKLIENDFTEPTRKINVASKLKIMTEEIEAPSSTIRPPVVVLQKLPNGNINFKGSRLYENRITAATATPTSKPELNPSNDNADLSRKPSLSQQKLQPHKSSENLTRNRQTKTHLNPRNTANKEEIPTKNVKLDSLHIISEQQINIQEILNQLASRQGALMDIVYQIARYFPIEMH